VSKKNKARNAADPTVTETVVELSAPALEQTGVDDQSDVSETEGASEVEDTTAPADEDETPAEPEVTEETVAEEPILEEIPEPTVAQTINADQIDPQYRPLVERLDEQFGLYRTAMAPGRPIGEHDGAMWQLRLWRLIDSVLRTSGPAFPIVFSHLLGLFHQEANGGVLDMRLRFRFLGALALGKTEGGNFQAIFAALLTVANPQDRALRLKQVDINRVFKNYPDRAAVDRIVDFFGL
jgi:hypothetical protein